MNIANVFARFAELSGYEDGELNRFRPLAETACRYVGSRCLIADPDAEQTARLELLAAAYALRLSETCNADGVTSFKAGDVSLTTSSADGADRSERLWRGLCAANPDLIAPEGFLFGRM